MDLHLNFEMLKWQKDTQSYKQITWGMLKTG